MSLRKLIALVLCFAALVAETATAATLTAGNYWPANPFPPNYVGYSNYYYNQSPPPFGSIANATLPDGMTIVAAYEIHAGAGADTQRVVGISGFSSDPGRGYMTSFTLNGSTKTTASALSYGYSSGMAFWYWQIPSITMTVGNSYSCTVNF
jgi:hypothetical protein